MKLILSILTLVLLSSPAFADPTPAAASVLVPGTYTNKRCGFLETETVLVYMDDSFQGLFTSYVAGPANTVVLKDGIMPYGSIWIDWLQYLVSIPTAREAHEIILRDFTSEGEVGPIKARIPSGTIKSMKGNRSVDDPDCIFFNEVQIIGAIAP